MFRTLELINLQTEHENRIVGKVVIEDVDREEKPLAQQEESVRHVFLLARRTTGIATGITTGVFGGGRVMPVADDE